MFFEVHRGLVGLGAMTIYRTAAQTAADIERFGKETGAMETQGGLFAQQSVFKYAASQGRLRDLQLEVEKLSSKLQGLQATLESKVRELEDMGVMKAGDYLKMGAKLVVGAKIPIIGWLSMASTFGNMIGVDLSFLDIDIFGDKKKKKQKIEKLIRECDALVKEMQYWSSRMAALQTEGETLAKSIKGGESAIDVSLIALPQHVETRHVYTDIKDSGGIMTGMTYEKKVKIRDTPESKMYGTTVFKTAEELAKRVALQPSGDRLPVGFQTIYSPVLEHGKIVAKMPQINAALPNPIDRRVVYGGLLSAMPEDTTNLVITSAIILGIMAYFLIDVKK